MIGKLEIAGEEINEVDVATYVGYVEVHTDRHLSWNSHLSQCIRTKVGVLFRLRHFVPTYSNIIT